MWVETPYGAPEILSVVQCMWSLSNMSLTSMGGNANSDISILLMKLRRNVDTSWSTQLTEVFIQSKGHPPVPLCRGQVSLFVTAVVCHTLHYFLSFIGASPLLISSKPSVTGLFWSVTVLEYLSYLNLQCFEAHLRSCLLRINHSWSSWLNHIWGTNNCIN